MKTTNVSKPTWNEVKEELMSEVEDMRGLMAEIEEDFDCADICETRQDFISNIKEAQSKAYKLQEELQSMLVLLRLLSDERKPGA